MQNVRASLTTITLAVLFSVFANLALANLAWAKFEVPQLTGPVVDAANILDSATIVKIEYWSRDVLAAGKAQIQVLTVSTLDGLPIEQAALQVVEKWKLGTAKADNGVLFMIAINDRQMRIEVGQGLEGDLPDVIAKRIIEDWVKPHFRNGDFNTGVTVAVEKIIEAAAPEVASRYNFESRTNHNYNYSRKTSNRSKIDLFTFLLFFIIIILNMIFSVFFRKNRRGNGSYWSNNLGGGGWSGGSGGFGGGGGGWSGGGGGFSGGGASGSW
jgi:uncharacterized protein